MTALRLQMDFLKLWFIFFFRFDLSCYFLIRKKNFTFNSNDANKVSLKLYQLNQPEKHWLCLRSCNWCQQCNFTVLAGKHTVMFCLCSNGRLPLLFSVNLLVHNLQFIRKTMTMHIISYSFLLPLFDYFPAITCNMKPSIKRYRICKYLTLQEKLETGPFSKEV